MSEQQRLQKVTKFMKANVCTDSSLEVRNAETVETPLSPLGLSSHMSARMWSKACSLIEEESALVHSPGDSSAWIVKSCSGQRPHYVKPSKGSYSCDEQCLTYKSAKICSHTIAVALKCNQLDKVIRWYRTMKCKPNSTAVAETGKPSSTGKKSRRKASSKQGTKHVRELLATVEESSFRSRAPQSSGHLSSATAMSQPHTVVSSSVQPHTAVSPSGRVAGASNYNTDVTPPCVVKNTVTNAGKAATVTVGNYSTQSITICTPPPPLHAAGKASTCNCSRDSSSTACASTICVRR